MIPEFRINLPEPNGILIDFPILTPSEVRSCGSEVEKYQGLFWKYCLWEGMPTCGVDLACGGKPGVPWAIPFDLSKEEYARYNSNYAPRGPIALTGHADKLPFEDDSLGFIICSHWLEDTGQHEWPMIFTEWKRCLRHGGNLIVLVPEVVRWNYAIRELGQCPNCSHSAPEPSVGDMSRVAVAIGFDVIEERLTELEKHDYSILGVFRKP